MNTEQHDKPQSKLSKWWDKHANTILDSPPPPAGVKDPYGDNSGPVQAVWSRVVAVFIFTFAFVSLFTVIGGVSQANRVTQSAAPSGVGGMIVIVAILLLSLAGIGILSAISKGQDDEMARTSDRLTADFYATLARNHKDDER